MKQKPAILVLCISVCISCAQVQDLDILGIDGKDEIYMFTNDLVSGRSTSTAIYDICDAFSKQMSNSGLSLLEISELTEEAEIVSKDEVFNYAVECIPAYSRTLNKFDLYSYSQLESDTLLLHFDMKYLSGYVDSILHNDKDLQFKRLVWKFGISTFSTTSIFNSANELLYDNILFNMINSELSYSCENYKAFITRGETASGTGIQSGSERVQFYNRINTLVAESWLWWEEFGHMASAPIYSADTLYAICHYYVHDYLDYNNDSWCYNNCLTTISRFEDISTTDAGRFRFCLWAGPVGYAPDISWYFQNFAPGAVFNLSAAINDGSSWTGCFTNGVVKMEQISLPTYYTYK